jgi:hypothetical protein
MNLILNGVEAVGEHEGKVEVRLTTRDVDPAEAEPRCGSGQLGPGLIASWRSGAASRESTRPFGRRSSIPFFTAKFAGRGLGLASTASIVRRLHSASCVESEPGHGATFQLLLPTERAAEARILLGILPAFQNVRMSFSSCLARILPSLPASRAGSR